MAIKGTNILPVKQKHFTAEGAEIAEEGIISSLKIQKP